MTGFPALFSTAVHDRTDMTVQRVTFRILTFRFCPITKHHFSLCLSVSTQLESLLLIIPHSHVISHLAFHPSLSLSLSLSPSLSLSLSLSLSPLSFSLLIILSLTAVPGLTLELFIDPDDQVGQKSTSSGLRMSLHEVGVKPYPEEDGFSLSPGFSTSIGVRQVNKTKRPWTALMLKNHLMTKAR